MVVPWTPLVDGINALVGRILEDRKLTLEDIIDQIPEEQGRRSYSYLFEEMSEKNAMRFMLEEGTVYSLRKDPNSNLSNVLKSAGMDEDRVRFRSRIDGEELGLYSNRTYSRNKAIRERVFYHLKNEEEWLSVEDLTELVFGERLGYQNRNYRALYRNLEGLTTRGVLKKTKKNGRNYYQINPEFRNLKPNNQNRGLTRRRFLQGMLGLVALSIIATTLPRSEVQGLKEAITAYAARKPLEKTVILPLADHWRKITWERHFKGVENIMPYEVWDMRCMDGRDSFESVVHWLEVLAGIYYEADQQRRIQNGLPRQHFGEYFSEFMDKLHHEADNHRINFVVLTKLLQISGRNITTLAGQNEDVDISRKQILLGAAGGLFDEIPYLSQVLGTNAIKIAITDRRPRVDYGDLNSITSYLARILNVNLPISRWNSVRMLGVPTVGINDIEPEVLGEAMLQYADPCISRNFREKYPSVAKSLEGVLYARRAVDLQKHEIRVKVEEYLHGYGERLEVFFDPATSEEAYNSIGLAPLVDPSQMVNYTRSWKQAVWWEDKIPDDNELRAKVSAKVIDEFRWLYNNEGSKAAYGALMRDQIDNPKFIKYLFEIARYPTEISKLNQLRLLLDKLDVLADKLRLANSRAYTELANQEYNTNFQLETGVATIKMMSKIAEEISGPVKPFDRDSILNNAFHAIAIREIAPITFLSDEYLGYPRLSVDPPYDRGRVILTFNQLKQSICEAGLIPPGYDESFDTWYYIYYQLAMGDPYGILPNEYREDILEYFNYNIFPPISPAFETALRFMRPHYDPTKVRILLDRYTQPPDLELDPYKLTLLYHNRLELMDIKPPQTEIGVVDNEYLLPK